MKTYIKLAWRNLWRSKRRTLITVASIFFGVFFAVFSSSMQKGSFENIVENMVRFYSGYIQIQDADYGENKSLNNSFEDNEYLESIILRNDKITQYTSRIESFALTSSGDNSFGAVVFGVDTKKENDISNLSKWVAEGEYFPFGTIGVLMGKQLAENLNLGVGDTLVMIGQGYHGVTAAGKYPVVGLLEFPLTELNKQMVYMDLENARDFYSMPGRSTSMILMVDKPDDVSAAIDEIKSYLSGDLKIYAWDELQPELKNFIQGKLAGGRIMKGILFMVIGFGIWGTIIMLMVERKRELGIMIALGVKKIRVIWILVFESFFIGLLGVLSGFIGSLPLIAYLNYNPIRVGGAIKETYESMGFEPILKFSIHPESFVNPAVTVFILFAIIAIYPVWYISRLKTVSALRA